MRLGPNPAMLARLSDVIHFPSRCTIYSVETVDQPNGETTRETTPRPGMADIPCRRTPEIIIRPTPEERPRETGTAVNERFIVMLKGIYNGITDEDIAILDTASYNIISAETDGSNTYTRLLVESR